MALMAFPRCYYRIWRGRGEPGSVRQAPSFWAQPVAECWERCAGSCRLPPLVSRWPRGPHLPSLPVRTPCARRPRAHGCAGASGSLIHVPRLNLPPLEVMQDLSDSSMFLGKFFLSSTPLLRRPAWPGPPSCLNYCRRLLPKSLTSTFVPCDSVKTCWISEVLKTQRSGGFSVT